MQVDVYCVGTEHVITHADNVLLPIKDYLVLRKADKARFFAGHEHLDESESIVGVPCGITVDNDKRRAMLSRIHLLEPSLEKSASLDASTNA
jgi:hypothetical protein